MRKLLLLGLVLTAQPLAAQQVVSVQSGDHPEFSRLVLQIDPDVDWEIEETRGLATIHFPNQALSFSIDQVFTRISTNRILSLSHENTQGGSSLQLVLNCKCDVQGFAFKGNYIVVDVYNGPEIDPIEVVDREPVWQPDALPFIQPPNTPSRFSSFVMAEAPRQPQLTPAPVIQEPVAAQEIGLQAADLMDDLLPTIDAAPHESHMEGGPEPHRSNMLAANAENIAPEAQSPHGVASVDEIEMAGAAVSSMNQDIEAVDDPELRARIEEAQNQLLAQLTRAADQGLVNFVPAPVVVAEVIEEDVPVEIEPEPPILDPALSQQLDVRTAYSQGTEDALTEIVNQFAKPQCLDDALFSFDGWSGEYGFSDQLAIFRSTLLGEFDTPDADTTLAIAQLYLRYGLGAEARLVLSESALEGAQLSILFDMADLLDVEPMRVSGPILKGAGCGGAHEMWYLATGQGNYQVLEPLSITDVFSDYPIEVRTLVGPPLAQAFIARGQVDAGHVVLEIVRRADGEVTPAQRMAEAKVMELQANMEGAERIYRELAVSNDELAPEALISYARSLFDSHSPVPPSLLVDLESASFFHRETDNAEALKLWEVKIRAKVEGADKALAQISELLAARPDMEAPLLGIVANIFETSTVESLGDYRYAEMVLKYASLLDQGRAGDLARLKIAEEMAGIGLPETALDILAPNFERPSKESDYVAAAAYVQLFQPSEAVEMLKNDPSLEAYKIRLSAYLQMEDYSMVAQMLREAHAQNISLNDVALRVGDWEKIQDAGDVGTLASYMQNGTYNPPENEGHQDVLLPMAADEEPSLKAARNLLEINQESRSFLEGMLAEGQN